MLPNLRGGASHGDGDLAPASATFDHLPDGLGDLAQWVAPADDRGELAVRDQLPQHLQVRLPWLGAQHPQPLTHQP
jgi:hypothetical protein